MKKGISLVALVITIIVLIILTGAIILTATNTNIFGKSEEAVFKNNVASFKEELTKKIMEKKLEDPTFSETTINATTSADIAQWIPSIAGTGYEDKFQIVGGKLVFTGEDTKQIEYVEKLGITASGTTTSNSSDSASDEPSSPNQETNPWMEFGLTSSNIVFDQIYRYPSANQEFFINSDGTSSLGSTEDLAEAIGIVAFIGSDYIFVLGDDEPEDPNDNWDIVIYFSDYGVMNLYMKNHSAGATKDSVMENADKSGTYTIGS